MKLENRRLSFMTLFLATAIMANAQGVKAQEDYMLDDAEDALGSSGTLDMDQINIDGKLSPSELLRRRREKLEERNKLMVEKKIEDIRVKQEIALTNKLQDAFGKSLNNLNEDKVQVQQAAPVAVAPAPVVVAPAPIIETRIVEVAAPVEKVVKTSKIIPSLGASTIKGDKIDFESNMNLNVSLETQVLPQVTVGLGLGYTSLNITDVSNDFVNLGVYNPYPTTGYQNVYGTGGRKMSLGKFSIEANSKFFLIEDSKIKPYVGGALSLNRSNLKYEDGGMYTSNGINYGTEGYTSSTLAGTAKLGAEVDFTETIAFNLDVSYTKNITSGIAKNADSTNLNPDQGRLENITKAIEESDTTAILAGLVVRF
jgi:hypothetical protein